MYALLVVLAAVSLIILIHPIVLARRCASRPSKPYNRWWVYCLWAIGGIIVGVAMLHERANVLGYDMFWAASESMSPTLERGDYFMVDPWRFRNSAPVVGDIVVYAIQRRPGVAFVKRIVGGPGDRVEGRAGLLYRNDVAVAEPYLHAPDNARTFGRTFGPTQLGPDEYFVLGDFRDNSVDSRTDGPVPRSSLRGRAEYIWYSAGKGVVRWQRFPQALH
jgi:signal peptidase I